MWEESAIYPGGEMRLRQYLRPESCCPYSIDFWWLFVTQQFVDRTPVFECRTWNSGQQSGAGFGENSTYSLPVNTTPTQRGTAGV
jgi:hypothetical protein